MKILVSEIGAVPRETQCVVEPGPLNARLSHGVRDYQACEGVAVSFSYYRAGLDLFFEGDLHGKLVGNCARCAEEYPFELDRHFSFVLTPRAALSGSRELRADDVAQSTYEGEEIDLAPLMQEQVILSLPTRPLCRESCAGLCPRCGANLNRGPCGCREEGGDLRLAVLRKLRIER